MKFGIPKEKLEQFQPWLVTCIKYNSSKLQSIISFLLHGIDEVNGVTYSSIIKNKLCESIYWVQLLVFEEPQVVLHELKNQATGTQGVCGAILQNNDIAYRCQTCEKQPICAICVPCSRIGNHVNHN